MHHKIVRLLLAHIRSSTQKITMIINVGKVAEV